MTKEVFTYKGITIEKTNDFHSVWRDSELNRMFQKFCEDNFNKYSHYASTWEDLLNKIDSFINQLEPIEYYIATN